MNRQRLYQRFFNVVAASRVGDAMGTPTEGLSPEQIDATFGWVTEFEGDGTDDSMMATILADTLTSTDSFATADEWAADIHRHRADILAKQDKFFASVLHLVEKLEFGYRPADVALGNMPSSSSAMCIWPVALVNVGQPDAAARQAYELGRLIHVNDADHCTDAAAALAAAIAAAFLPDASISSCTTEAVKAIRPTSGRSFRDALLDAIQLASDSKSYQDFRTSYQARFARPTVCDSLETVPAAFALATLADGDVRAAVEYSANFGRDTDTIASMAGALCGALSADIPQSWLDALGPEAVDSATELAGRLLNAATERARREQDRIGVALDLLGDAQ
jgi:ADP-ribosylglycohydrolase